MNKGLIAQHANGTIENTTRASFDFAGSAA
jgi:hypothetical protein